MRNTVVIAIALVAAAETAADSGRLEEIVVTGSRIGVMPLETSAAVLVLDRADLDRREFGSLGDALQALPVSTGSPINTSVNGTREAQGGDGSVRIDLRGLGPGRTLVLLNGRRFVPGGLGGDSSVDLSAIPMSSVARVEVQGAGASAVHGADAVAGVVNVLTRRAIDGIEARAGYSTSSEGDGAQRIASLAAGNLSRVGSWIGAIEWADQDSVVMDAREFSAERESLLADGTPVAFGVAQTPAGFFRVPPGNELGLVPGIYTRIDGSSNPAGADDFRPFVDPEDRYNFNQGRYLQSPWRRTGLWLEGERTINMRWRTHAEALLQHRQSEQRIAAAPIDTRFGIGIPELGNGLSGIPVDNYYNPFGISLRDVRRRVVEAGNRRYEQDAQTYYIQAGLEGEAWDGMQILASAAWAQNSSRQVTHGELRADRLQLALGPSGLDADGQLVCGPPDPVTGVVPESARIDGCVPLDVFGGQGPEGRGTITSQQLDYLSEPLVDHGRNEMVLFEAELRGRWIRSPGRELRWVAGIELRHDSAYRRPDPDTAGGTTGSVGTAFRGGEADAAEIFAEARLPFGSGQGVLRRLDMTLGGRWSHFSSFGSNTSATAGFLWQPIAGVALRASYSGVFRAPPLSDLYSDEFHFYTVARDPCGNSPTPEEQSNCAAAGVPGGSYVQPLLDETLNVTGGNAALEPESGRSWSVGLGIASPALDGLSVALSLWDVSLHDAIRSLSDQTLLTECARSGDPGPCSHITRNPDGSVQMVDTRWTNIGGESARGVEADASYRWQAGAAELRARISATYLQHRVIDPIGHSAGIRVAGRKFDNQLFPQWRALASMDARWRTWTAGIGLQYIGNVEECVAAEPTTVALYSGCRDIEPVLYTDMSIGYASANGLRASLLVSNLGNEDPPRVISTPYEANTNAATYRLLGRTYTMRLELRTP